MSNNLERVLKHSASVLFLKSNAPLAGCSRVACVSHCVSVPLTRMHIVPPLCPGTPCRM